MMKWASAMAMRFARVLAVGPGLLLTPAAALGQSLVSPTWIQHAWANESGFGVRPHAISVNEENVFVTSRDLLGRKVGTLVDGVKQAGRHEVVFEANNLLSGTYIYRLYVADKIAGGTMFLLR